MEDINLAEKSRVKRVDINRFNKLKGDVDILMIKTNTSSLRQLREFKSKFRKMFKSNQVLFEEFSGENSTLTTCNRTSSLIDFSKSLERLKIDAPGPSTSSTTTASLTATTTASNSVNTAQIISIINN